MRGAFVLVAPAATFSAPINATGDVTSNVIFGCGTANGSFTGVRQEYSTPNTLPGKQPGIELGLRAKLRFNEKNQSENTSNYDGVDTYSFIAGAAPGGFGLDANSPKTPVWKFEWHITTDDFTGLPFVGLTSLDSFTCELHINGKVAVGTKFAIFDPINVPFADHALGISTPANGAGVTASDAADYAFLINNRPATQNSWNYGFFNEAPDTVFLAQLSLFAPSAPGSYRTELEAFRDGTSIASTGININVAPLPVPASAVLLLGDMGDFAAQIRVLKTALPAGQSNAR